MNITTIREKYPQYSDLTDKQLVDALHDKFYNDIPIKQFYATVGFVETTPIKSINSTQSNINNTQVIQNQSHTSQSSQTTKNDFDPGMIIGAVLLTAGAMKILVEWLRTNKSKANTTPNFISIIWPYIFGLGFVCWGISQFIAGYEGISSYAGTGWAIAAIVVSFMFRFILPITIGAFYGALVIWNWPWYWALIFAAPGLVLVIPSILTSVIAGFNRQNKNDSWNN